MTTSAWGGNSFAEVLKRKIVKDAEDAKIRLVEEAKAREEEAKAKEARLAELKLKREQEAARRQAQAEAEEQYYKQNPGSYSRFSFHGRRRFGRRGFIEQHQAHEEIPVTTDQQSNSDAPTNDESEKSAVVENVVPHVPAVAVPSAQPVCEDVNTPEKEDPVQPSSVPVTSTTAVIDCVVPSAKQQDSVKEDSTNRKAPTAKDSLPPAQKSHGRPTPHSQNQEPLRNASAAPVAAPHLNGNGQYRYPLFQPGFNNGYHPTAQHPTYGGQYPAPQSFHGNGGQYYQSMTQITTRNGPLFVNPQAYPTYALNDMYAAGGGTPTDFYGHSGNLNNGYYAEGHTHGDDLHSPPNVQSPLPSLIKSFYFDSELIGVVMGKQGKSLQDDRRRSDCEIWIDDVEAKKCGISTLHFYGLPENVDSAAESVRRRLQEVGCSELYPIMGIVTGSELHPPISRLNLPDGVVLRAFISHVDEAGGRVFVQLPSHPSYPKLRGLEMRLSNYCSDANLSPYIDVRHSPVIEGCIVAASVNDDCERWFRAAVISQPNEDGEMQLRSLDHGFSFRSHATSLKFLPVEFCATPAQAIECRVVSGRFDHEKLVAIQIDQKVSATLLKQWIKVKAVATEELTELPVVEIMLTSTNSSTTTIPSHQSAASILS
ncbi:hypothetical protein BV898_08448 [Hypsibius exemplaris]|uniref:K Homology domain-containing protein n=1 Tax=Hypsibius exemplaris TaxID=2072580 RepID=A0A1W0WQN3_HYPEX|nr:hypothetical protein BV898_08448 [Hypsibius exemplaris]